MPTIIPLQNSAERSVAPALNQNDTPHEGVAQEKLERQVGQRLMSDMVDFLCMKGDKETIGNFKHVLSDYSRAKGHIYDEQIDKLDEWLMNENKRTEDIYKSVIEKLVDSKIDVQGNYYDIHNNKIEK